MQQQYGSYRTGSTHQLPLALTRVQPLGRLQAGGKCGEEVRRTLNFEKGCSGRRAACLHAFIHSCVCVHALRGCVVGRTLQHAQQIARGTLFGACTRLQVASVVPPSHVDASMQRAGGGGEALAPQLGACRRGVQSRLAPRWTDTPAPYADVAALHGNALHCTRTMPIVSGIQALVSGLGISMVSYCAPARRHPRQPVTHTRHPHANPSPNPKPQCKLLSHPPRCIPGCTFQP